MAVRVDEGFVGGEDFFEGASHEMGGVDVVASESDATAYP